MSFTKLSLAGNNLIIPGAARESLVSDIPAGDGKIVNLFYSVWALLCSRFSFFLEGCTRDI
jgi:hypothetical protein